MTQQQASDITSVLSPSLGAPLGVIRNPADHVSIAAGEKLELSVTISNEGSISAIIDASIESQSDPYHWCQLAQQMVALNPGESREVLFEINVPASILPGSYSYVLAVDSQRDYPEVTPLRFFSQIQVTPPLQALVEATEPTFFIVPTTTTQSPTSITPGEPIQLSAMVDNRSDRVDQFRLSCPNIGAEWHQIIYPDQYLDSGVSIDADALELNPSSQGQIQVVFLPPTTLEAGLYSPTLKLTSLNFPESQWLGMTYFHVQPVYQLDVELLTLLGRVNTQPGSFEIRIFNRGNTVREIDLSVNSLNNEVHCAYTLTPNSIRLLPYTSTCVNLSVQPQNIWRRSFFGRSLNFVVQLSDRQQLPLVSDRYQGAVILEPRPWWQFYLLILAVVGAIATIIFLIYWAMTRPPIRPRLVSFYPIANTVEEASNESIRLNWSIQSPQKINRLKLQGLGPDDSVISGPFEFDLSQGIPDELTPFCKQKKILRCVNVPTDARQPGDYIFELQLVSSSESQIEPISFKTNVVKILPIPEPEILSFESLKPTYQEQSQNKINQTSKSSSISLSTELSSSCPHLDHDSLKTQGSPSGILLKWDISNADRIGKITLIGRTPDGVVSHPLCLLDLTHDIPEILKQRCKITKPQILRCSAINVKPTEAGKYIFELGVILKPRTGISRGNLNTANDTSKIVANSNVILVNPVQTPIEIVDFKVQGEDAPAKYIVPLYTGKPFPLILSWTIEGSSKLTTTLLPAPGTVQSKDQITYKIGPNPGTTVFTLQAQDEFGAQMTRSVEIEAIAPPNSVDPSQSISGLREGVTLPIFLSD